RQLCRTCCHYEFSTVRYGYAVVLLNIPRLSAMVENRSIKHRFFDAQL
ncbi:MAG: hypothetical protein ACI9RV_002006, partial [Glaciecola sp.]